MCIFPLVQLLKMRIHMKLPSRMKKTTLNSKDFSTRVIKTLTVNTLNLLFIFFSFMIYNIMISLTYPVGLPQIHPHPLARLQSTTHTWWSPTCGPSYRSLWRKTPGCRKELKIWKRRGTFCVASWTALYFPQRAKDRSRVRASTVTVRTVVRCWPVRQADLKQSFLQLISTFWCLFPRRLWI